MTAPSRVQRKRTRGWKMPQNTIYVGRGSKWGNPYPLPADADADDRALVVERYRELFDNRPSRTRHDVLRFMRGNRGRGEGAVLAIRTSLRELRGKNLACWCRLDQPCHADVLLAIANAPEIQ